MAKTAIVVGASGLIGVALVRQLCASGEYEKVRALVRRPLDYTHPSLENIVIDFDRPETFEEVVSGNALFCCLGTTQHKTPDKKEYYKIDHDYPLAMARLALTNGITQMHIVSSVGANVNSKVFYTRMKGETERDISNLGIKSVYIYRPSFLSGHREETRPLEKLGLQLFRLVKPLMRGRLKKFRSIEGETVARAMFLLSFQPRPGVHIYESDQIQSIGIGRTSASQAFNN